MLLLWLDLNSSYAHSSLALPAIHAQVEGKEGNNDYYPLYLPGRCAA